MSSNMRIMFHCNGISLYHNGHYTVYNSVLRKQWLDGTFSVALENRWNLLNRLQTSIFAGYAWLRRMIYIHLQHNALCSYTIHVYITVQLV
jgi:hypothetical protein